MAKRYAAIWFLHLTTDWLTRRRPELKQVPFVFAAPVHGRMVVKNANKAAYAKGIYPQMVVADCRAVLPSLQVFDDIPGKADMLLHALAEWSIRYTPVVAVDPPDGLLLDISGCAHLWGGEEQYLNHLMSRYQAFGYDVRIALADTIGTAWAIARYGTPQKPIIATGKQVDALLPLSPAALRIDPSLVERLVKLGLTQIQRLIHMPRTALSRRFGQHFLTRLDQALGQETELLEPVCPIQPYEERLPCLEPICTATGIEIALRKLLETLCSRFAREDTGLRSCVFKGYRIDGNIQQIAIGTNRPSRNMEHLFKLFEIKMPGIEPGLGFELFILEAPVVETLTSAQEAIWNTAANKNNLAVAELLDTIAGKVGAPAIHRYLPDEHYIPERSIRPAASLQELPGTAWRTDMPRPLHLLPIPEPIEVTVAMPDYPPILFRYKGTLHRIQKADGAERIEQEWWIEQGVYRDYYSVEDDTGARYWIYRSGDYKNSEPKWFLHGFFA